MPASTPLRMTWKRLIAIRTAHDVPRHSRVSRFSVNVASCEVLSEPPLAPNGSHDVSREYKEDGVDTQRVRSAWKRLASLTNDPMIHQVSKRLATERSLPKTLTLAMKDPRPCMILSIDEDSKSVVMDNNSEEDDNVGLTSTSLAYSGASSHTVVNVNDAFTRLSGYPREEALNQSMERLLSGPETEQDAARIMMETIAMGYKSTAQGVVTHYARNGRKFQDLMRLGTIVSGDGSTRYLLCVLHEIAHTVVAAENDSGSARFAA